MNKIIIPIKGLHCRSCEALVHEKITQIDGVKGAKVSFKKSNVEIEFDGRIMPETFSAAIESAGYSVGSENLSWISKNHGDWYALGAIVGVLALAAFLFNLSGVKLDLFRFGEPENLLTVALIGLAAGFSTCMALTGGLLLALSAKYSAKHPKADIYSKLVPQLMFNSGRLASYALLGGVIGLIGSAFQISSTFWAILTAIAASVMLLLGVQLISVFPKFSLWSISLPNFKFLKKIDGETYSHYGALLLGALTFFLPCGFTQAMQLYAVSTGDFFSGLLVMLVFAIGTLPGLLLAGLAGTFIRGKWSKIFMMLIGVVVIAFALYNLNNAANLLGLGNFSLGSNTISETTCADGKTLPDSGVCPIENLSAETQIIKADYTLADDIIPSEFTVKAGAPVRFEVNALDNGSGCMSTIMIPGLYNKPIYLAKGKQIVMEFTPKKAGTYPITCAMGVKRGILTVK